MVKAPNVCRWQLLDVDPLVLTTSDQLVTSCSDWTREMEAGVEELDSFESFGSDALEISCAIADWVQMMADVEEGESRESYVTNLKNLAEYVAELSFQMDLPKTGWLLYFKRFEGTLFAEEEAGEFHSRMWGFVYESDFRTKRDSTHDLDWDVGSRTVDLVSGDDGEPEDGRQRENESKSREDGRHLGNESE